MQLHTETRQVVASAFLAVHNAQCPVDDGSKVPEGAHRHRDLASGGDDVLDDQKVTACDAGTLGQPSGGTRVASPEAI